MSDYTPTTEDVRDSYCDSNARHENFGSAHITEEQHERFHAEFDRWIAERDREVAEKAWDEAREAFVRSGTPGLHDNKYRKEK